MKEPCIKFPGGARPGSLAAAALFALLVGLLPGAGNLQAATSPPVLGTDGDIYQITAGRYIELFLGGSETSPNAEVLRLEVRRGSGEGEHYLVPGSESDDRDRTPSLFHDAATGRLHIVWSSSNDSTLTRINLVSFDGDVWSELIEVSANIFSNKSAPRVAVTHDRFELAEGSSGESSTRTILHVVWSEETANGEKVMYAPVVMIDGKLASTARRVHRLNDYVSQELIDSPFPGRVPARLLGAPTVDAALEANAVMIGFVDDASGALVQLEIAIPAAELAELADSLAGRLESSNLCQRLQNGEAGAVSSVAEAARVHIVLVGRRIRSRVLGPMAEDTKSVLVQRSAELCAEGGLRAVTQAARVHIVLVGARSQDGDLLAEGDLPGQDALGDSHVLLAAAQPVEGGQVHHLARLLVKSERSAPTIGPGQTTIFVSPEGTGAVVAWKKGSLLTWVETDPASDGWSESFELEIGDGVSRAEAYFMLRERARSRMQ